MDLGEGNWAWVNFGWGDLDLLVIDCQETLTELINLKTLISDTNYKTPDQL